MSEFNLIHAQRIVFESGLGPSEKLLVLALLDHWSKASPEPSPGVGRLVSWTSLSRPTVIAVIGRLVSSGALPEPGRGTRGAHVFDVVLLVKNLHQSTGKESNQSLVKKQHRSLVKNPNQSKMTTGKETRSPLVKKRVTTGKVGSITEGQNACGSLEGTIEGTIEGFLTGVSDTKQAPPKSPIPELWKTYFDEYERSHGAKPQGTKSWRGRAAKAFEELLHAYPGEGPDIIRRAFADSWHATNRCQPWEILADANKLRGNARPTKRGVAPPQPNSGFDFSQYEG